MLDLYDITRSQLGEWVASCAGSAVHAARVWRYLYREGVREVAAMRELPARLRERLARDAAPTTLVLADEVRSGDGLTQKYLLELADGRQVETVLMRMRGRLTACLSSQVGCPLGCVFCATGQMGFARNLTTGEIVAQALYVNSAGMDGLHRRESLRNIVLMGMGEPLLNYDAVVRAMEILRDPGGLAIGSKQITLSTVGVVPGIIRLADEAQPCSLAVSLHAADQDERAALVPAARTWPLDVLLDACRYYAARLGRRIFFEWTLIAGSNDSARHAHALARLVRDIPAQINLIPLNPTLGYRGTPGRGEAVDRFRMILRDYGLPVSIRQRRGIEIAAGCGQLAGG
ncbi:MAG TPA: 23S rRNA (adenine(2503)-C(2))-methyltransferase RlmN [Pirellulales bacterium]|jgi:23S rRNA (adenine2503-C2)-methyltransferase|nr:23S rRNA (adenine(2503)-C(2))-methyltransferase RlmN [Pirellulales bacterium]